MQFPYRYFPSRQTPIFPSITSSLHLFRPVVEIEGGLGAVEAHRVGGAHVVHTQTKHKFSTNRSDHAAAVKDLQRTELGTFKGLEVRTNRRDVRLLYYVLASSTND